MYIIIFLFLYILQPPPQIFYLLHTVDSISPFHTPNSCPSASQYSVFFVYAFVFVWFHLFIYFCFFIFLIFHIWGKDIEDNTNICRDILCSCIGRTNIVKMIILPKEINRFNANPIKISRTSFTGVEQKISIWNQRTSQVARTILREKKQKTELEISLPNFKLDYKVIIIKQHSIETKTDTYINGTELRAQQ